MKKLFIFRHAKASAQRAGLADIERPLVNKGVKTARVMARKLKELGVKPELLISSPASRALETAHIFAREFRYPVQKIRLEDVIYEGATHESLLSLVRRFDDSRRVVFLFGHNPSLQDFAQVLVKDFPGRLPKMGVLEVEFPGNSWKSAGPGAGKLGFFDYPDWEAEDARHKIDDLAAQLARAMEIVLERMNSTALEDILLTVERASRKIAEEFLAGLERRRAAAARKSAGKGEKAGGSSIKRSSERATAKTPVASPACQAVLKDGKPSGRRSGGALKSRKIRYIKPKLEKKDAVPSDPRLSGGAESRLQPPPLPGESSAPETGSRSGILIPSTRSKRKPKR